MKIIADAFGGDNAPAAVIEGCAAAVREYGVEILLCGDEEKIKSCAEEKGISLQNIEILDAPDVISMHDNPKTILKEKSNSSMAVGLKALADGMGDAFVSAGSTGALVFGSTFIVKRIKGVKRAAFGSALPTVNGKYYFLMDEGANVDCRPEMLLQFSVLASAYVESSMGIENPTVGLLNIGVEDTKGGELQLAAYELLKSAPINFIGNVEARDLMNGVCDIVITDGFSGNICLKTLEGVASGLMGMVKSAFKKNIITKLGAVLSMSGLKGLKDTLDYTKVGGAPVIGVKKPVFKAHGNSDAKAFKNSIGGAIKAVNGGMIEKLEKTVEQIKENDEKE